MLTVLRHIPCPSCGHRHNFTLPAGDLSPGREYAYVCPETGALVTGGDCQLLTPGGRSTYSHGPGEVTAVLDTLGQAVDRFCAQLGREGYMVDRERAGDLHLILVRNWDGEVVGRYVASGAAGRI